MDENEAHKLTRGTLVMRNKNPKDTGVVTALTPKYIMILWDINKDKLEVGYRYSNTQKIDVLG